ncbi:MAG: tRNA pseudouridine(13) synthase TruD, partial [Xanthomonas perforans]|nr:tRNA pseudouridine(13) synthase TruD [Xanthomonas perforans]
QVDELPSFEPSGEGEHLLLTIRKRGQNTAYIARQLAQWAGIAEMGVSYAGLKDRHAVTTQRFSVHLPKRIAPDLATLDDAQMQ